MLKINMTVTASVVLVVLVVTFTWDPTESITLPGYENERYIHICKLESRNLVCEAGTFLWIRSVSVGVSSNHVVDADTGAISCPISTSDDCLKPTLRYREGTTYRVFNGLNVPDEMVMCGGVATPANFVHIRYSCIDSTLLSPQDMCSSSTRGFPEGYITTPGFPSSPPEQLYDCSCQLRPEVPSADGMEVSVIVMYARLPEPENCAEKTWLEDQDGQHIRLEKEGLNELCSTSTYVSLLNTTRVQGLTLRFVRTREDYSGSLKLKVWYGFQADTHMRVTCGPTHATNDSSTTTTSPSTTTTIRLPQLTHDLLSGTTTTTIRPAEPTEVILSPPSGTLFLGLNLDTIVTIGAIVGFALLLIIVAIVIAVITIKKRRPPPPVHAHYNTGASHEEIPELYLTTPMKPVVENRPLPRPPPENPIYGKDFTRDSGDYTEVDEGYETPVNPYYLLPAITR